MTYASDTYVMTKTNEKKIERWQWKIVRKPFGGMKGKFRWKRRTNAELRNLYKDPITAAFIRFQRIKWLRHIKRLRANIRTKVALERKPIGLRRRGKWRKR